MGEDEDEEEDEDVVKDEGVEGSSDSNRGRDREEGSQSPTLDDTS